MTCVTHYDHFAIINPADRPGLRNTDLVQKIHRKLDSLLQKSVTANHPDNPNLFCELKKKIPDLRTLNTLHSEKLLAYKMEPRLGSAASVVVGSSTSSTSTTASSPEVTNGSVTNGGTCNYPSLLPDRWHSLNLLAAATSGQNSPNGSEFDMSYGSPRSVSSSVISNDDQSIKSPPRSASASSAKSNGYINGDNDGVRGHIHAGPYSPPSTGDLRCPKSRSASSMTKAVSSTSGAISATEHGCSSGDESYYVADSPVKTGSSSTSTGNGFSKIRRVDSPTDSGIESGKEHCSGSTPTTSVCSSPRSALDEKVKDVSDSESNEKQETIDDMPMLKRALQAPPLINSNMLMDEAYRHHKKFRATKREGSSPSPSTTTPNESPLASSHSTLVKSLEQAPRFLNEQQLKRTDLIHNIIMRSGGESSLPTSSSSSSSSSSSLSTSSSSMPEARFQSLNVPAHHSVTKGSNLLMGPGSYTGGIPPAFSSGCPYSGPQVSRIMYTGSMQSDALSARRSPAHHHSSIPSPHHPLASQSPVALVMGPSSQPKPCVSPLAASLPLSSPVAGVAIKMSQSSDLMSDSQPLNLSMSKRVSTPNSPTVTVKMESS